MKRSKNTTRALRVLPATIALLGVAGTAVAQGVLEEITVTATKRESTIQDVPFSINAQTAKDIERTGATDLESLSRNVAGLTIQNLGPGQSQVAIRGVSAGQIVRDQPGVKEQVGVYLDESVISLGASMGGFFLRAFALILNLMKTFAIRLFRSKSCSRSTPPVLPSRAAISLVSSRSSLTAFA